MNRFSFDDYLRAAGTSSISQLSARTGICRRTLHRWAHDGIPPMSADRAAIALGLHPASVWPCDWWLADVA